MKRWVTPLWVSTLTALPLGGFLFGCVSCQDCGWNIFGRAFVGAVMAVLTTFTLGFPPRNEGGVGPPYNAWPCILAAWALGFGLLYWRATRRRAEPPPLDPGPPAV